MVRRLPWCSWAIPMKRTNDYNKEMRYRGKYLIPGLSLQGVLQKGGLTCYSWKNKIYYRWQTGGRNHADHHAKPQYAELTLDTSCKCKTCTESKLLIISRSPGRMHIKMQNEIEIEKAAVKSSSIMLQFGCGNPLTGSFRIFVQSQKAWLGQHSFTKHRQACILTEIIGGMICFSAWALNITQAAAFLPPNKESQSPCQLRRTNQIHPINVLNKVTKKKG